MPDTKTDQPVQSGGDAESFTGPHRFEMDGWISRAPFEALLNMEIVEVGEGRAVLTMPFLKEYAQGAGLLHGGALVSLGDTAVVMAIKSIVPPETHFATISLESKFLSPVRQGIVTARAYAEPLEDRRLQGKAILYGEGEKPVMEFTSIFKIARDARIKGVSFLK